MSENEHREPEIDVSSAVDALHTGEVHDINITPELPDIKGPSREELAKNEAIITKIQEEERRNSRGNLLRVESMKGTDYIQFVYEKTVVPVARRDALERAKSLLDTLMTETRSANSQDMEKDIWLCWETFKACIANGRENGLEYKSDSIQQFEKMIKHAETSWRNREEMIAKRSASDIAHRAGL